MKKGYTLIELILVVSALMLISAFGIGRYNEFNERQNVQQAADSFISNLRLVQAKALAGDKPQGCTTLVGWTVEFALKSYTMYAECKPEGIIDSTRVTVDLPGNVNLTYSIGFITYYPLGRGTSTDQEVQIVGRQITVPVVLSASSISKKPTVATIYPALVATPTPMPASCPWPAGDPRCEELGPYPTGATPTPTTPPGGDTPTPTTPPAQFACQASGGTWKLYFLSCHDECYYVNNPPICVVETTYSCDCGTSNCWDGATCVNNPSVTPTPTPFPTPTPQHQI